MVRLSPLRIWIAATRGSALPKGPLLARSFAYSSARYSIAWPRISRARPLSGECRRRTKGRGRADEVTGRGGIGQSKKGSWFADLSGAGARRILSMIPPHGEPIGQKARLLRVAA